ncbi:MAG: peptide chain release factor 2 [bacterium]
MKNQIKDLLNRLSNLRRFLDLETKEKQIKSLENSAASPDFWNQNKKAQETLKQLSKLKSFTETWDKYRKMALEIQELYKLAEEEGDTGVFGELRADLEKVRDGINELELKKMLSGEDDERYAIFTIHSGAGGTESQDWANMLLRMYTRWFERRGFACELLDLLPGEEAGIKSATLDVKGENAFGYLKAEIGVHRLVRISPFDAGARRHTSFASIYALPQVEELQLVKIDENDVKVDTYRASGAGGQHINKTDSAVRMTHMPTGIVVQCQSQRSQIQNREACFKILKARIYQQQREEEEKKRDAKLAQKKKIEWGSQIRSYVMHPYKMVKDLRTQVETSNVQDVMDGDLDRFVEAYLLQVDSGKSAI